jgi:hypothetical protein
MASLGMRGYGRTMHDLQLEVKALRERVEQERMREPSPPSKPNIPEPPAAVEPETPRLSRVERYRKPRWF